MTKTKKILIGIGVAFVVLIVLALVLPGSETETDTAVDPVVTATATPTATPEPIAPTPSPTVVPVTPTTPEPTAEPTAVPTPEPPTETPEPVAVSSLAGCRPADDIRCEVYRNLFFQISTVYFPDTNVEFTDADFNWVDCVAFVASEHLFPDSDRALVEWAVQDGLNTCGSAP